MTPMENFEKYTKNSWSGQDLLKKHKLDDEGIWEIYGEDPNCDFGGHHHTPKLGTVQGKLRDVIMYGVSLPNFWQWGSGGHFTLLGKEIPKVDQHSWQERADLEAEEKRLKEELDAVKSKLKNFKK
jgi:hypothetical protein